MSYVQKKRDAAIKAYAQESFEVVQEALKWARNPGRGDPYSFKFIQDAQKVFDGVAGLYPTGKAS